MALRNSDAHVQLCRGDWPKIVVVDGAIYEPDHIAKFLEACEE